MCVRAIGALSVFNEITRRDPREIDQAKKDDAWVALFFGMRGGTGES